jgi:surfactin synthase thioesterase subunit
MTPGPAWVRIFHPNECDLPNLICLPYAGGSASSYFALSAHLSGAVAVMAVQYPGRQDRYVEPAVVAMDDLVDGLVEAVRPVADRPYALFGHSMGALVAYELALRLERDGAPAPLRLFASGRRSPSRLRSNDEQHRKPEADLVRYVLSLGGIAPEVLRDPDLRAMVLPVLRADLALVERYRAEPGSRVACPITVLVGDRDPVVDRDEALAWQEHTRAGCELMTFAGGHFYLRHHLSELARTVHDRLARVHGHRDIEQGADVAPLQPVSGAAAAGRPRPSMDSRTAASLVVRL